jgi:rhodanese-related sulfurtransferase
MQILLFVLMTTLAPPDIRQVTPQELREAMQRGDAVAVDVRGTVPYELGHIDGAVWMPLGLMNQRAGELPQEKLIVTYCTCKAEETSLEAARLLANAHGFKRVAVLKGGYPAWMNAGYPVKSNRTVEAPRAGGGRFAPPAAVTCDRNQLTSHAGKVVHYRRLRGKTVLVIDTHAATRETVTLRHRGSEDPSRFFLIDGTPFTARDWNRVEVRKGEVRKGLTAIAWVCSDGSVIVDWRPGLTLTGAE